MCVDIAEEVEATLDFNVVRGGGLPRRGLGINDAAEAFTCPHSQS